MVSNITLLWHFVTLLRQFVTSISKVENIFPILKCWVMKVRHGQHASAVRVLDCFHLKSIVPKNKTVFTYLEKVCFILKLCNCFWIVSIKKSYWYDRHLSDAEGGDHRRVRQQGRQHSRIRHVGKRGKV